MGLDRSLPTWTCSGSEQGVFWKRGLVQKSPFSRDSTSRECTTVEILEDSKNLQILENEGESDHFLENLENLEIIEILEVLEIKGPFRKPCFCGSEKIPKTPTKFPALFHSEK